MTAPVAILAAQRTERGPDVRMEELIFAAAAGTLAAAGVTRDQIDSVVLSASDEKDGRSISSMLGSAPAGGLLKQVTKVTDGSLHALALAAMKVQAGESDAVLVVSWDVGSEAPLHDVAISALEPFADRAIGATDPAATALVASAYLATAGGGTELLDERATRKHAAAGVGDGAGDWLAHPLREGHFAPDRDGAAAALLVSDRFLSSQRREPAALLEGVGWRTDTYAPNERLRPVWLPLRGAVGDALARAGVELGDIDSFEVEDSSVFAECVAAEGLGLAEEGRGLEFLVASEDPFRRRAEDGFAGLPQMCSGLWRLAQVCESGEGGRSLLHQTVGRAGQGHAVAIVRRGATKEAS